MARTKIQIVSSKSNFQPSFCNRFLCAIHPSTVDCRVECKVNGSNIVLYFELSVSNFLGYTRINPSQWDEDFGIEINGVWQGSETAKIFLRKYWNSLTAEPRAEAATGFALLKQRSRSEKDEKVRQKQEVRARAARELSEARKKISEL